MLQRSGRMLGLALGVTGATAFVAGFGSAAVAEWKPRKPVEFVVMAGKGGGADKAVRLMQSIIAKEKLAAVPVVPVNKPGGSGAEALVYMKGKKGDDHTIMFTLNSFYTTPLRQKKLGIDVTKFTPVMRMAEDTFCLWVVQHTPFETCAGQTASWPSRRLGPSRRAALPVSGRATEHRGSSGASWV